MENESMEILTEEEAMKVNGGCGGSVLAAWGIIETVSTVITGKSASRHIHEGIKSVRERDVEATPMVGFGGATAKEF